MSNFFIDRAIEVRFSFSAPLERNNFIGFVQNFHRNRFILIWKEQETGKFPLFQRGLRTSRVWNRHNEPQKEKKQEKNGTKTHYTSKHYQIFFCQTNIKNYISVH